MCFSSLDWETLVESQELHYLPQQTYVQTRTDPMMNTKCHHHPTSTFLLRYGRTAYLERDPVIWSYGTVDNKGICHMHYPSLRFSKFSPNSRVFLVFSAEDVAPLRAPLTTRHVLRCFLKIYFLSG